MASPATVTLINNSTGDVQQLAEPPAGLPDLAVKAAWIKLNVNNLKWAKNARVTVLSGGTNAIYENGTLAVPVADDMIAVVTVIKKTQLDNFLLTNVNPGSKPMAPQPQIMGPRQQSLAPSAAAAPLKGQATLKAAPKLKEGKKGKKAKQNKAPKAKPEAAGVKPIPKPVKAPKEAREPRFPVMPQFTSVADLTVWMQNNVAELSTQLEAKKVEAQGAIVTSAQEALTAKPDEYSLEELQVLIPLFTQQQELRNAIVGQDFLPRKWVSFLRRIHAIRNPPPAVPEPVLPAILPSSVSTSLPSVGLPSLTSPTLGAPKLSPPKLSLNPGRPLGGLGSLNPGGLGQ